MPPFPYRVEHHHLGLDGCVAIECQNDGANISSPYLQLAVCVLATGLFTGHGVYPRTLWVLEASSVVNELLDATPLLLLILTTPLRRAQFV